MWNLISNLINLNSALARKARSVTAYDEALAYYEKKEFKRAHPLIQEAAELGNAQAMGMLGTNYLMGTGVPENGKEAEKWLLAAVDAGYVDAVGVLGMGYATGKAGFPRNMDLAKKLLTQAAEAGDKESATMLDMIAKGAGIFAKRQK